MSAKANWDMSINKPYDFQCQWVSIFFFIQLKMLLFSEFSSFLFGLNEGAWVWMCSEIPHGASTQLSKCKHDSCPLLLSFLFSLFWAWNLKFPDFQDVREDLRCSMAKDVVTIKNESLKIGEDLDCAEVLSKLGKEESLAQLPKDSSLDFQKKITLSKHENQDNSSSSFFGNREAYKQLLGMYKLWCSIISAFIIFPTWS